MAIVTVSISDNTVEIYDVDYSAFHYDTRDFIGIDEILEHEYGLKRTHPWTSDRNGEVFATAQPIEPGELKARDTV